MLMYVNIVQVIRYPRRHLTDIDCESQSQRDFDECACKWKVSCDVLGGTRKYSYMSAVDE